VSIGGGARRAGLVPVAAANPAPRNRRTTMITNGKASAPTEVDNSSDKAPRNPTRLDQMQALITRDQGASITELMDATGWQQHSVRGALAGALKKRGLMIRSEKVDSLRRYHASVLVQ